MKKLVTSIGVSVALMLSLAACSVTDGSTATATDSTVSAAVDKALADLNGKVLSLAPFNHNLNIKQLSDTD